ncbi:MAG: metal-sensitive transcriptional regulator [Armatimonadetes bacterium]|nr:metal-sensitive transcriptional regulator [Armatimonadota bacterium]MDE2207165.1 metal-sensitive transcriptional regulator [Armatimonadota bacterium]
MPVIDQTKRDVLNRLSRVEGQVRGVKRLVENEAYCVEVLTQISAIHEALRAAGKVIMRNHLETCVTDALRRGDPVEAERIHREMMDVIYKFAK